MRLATWNVNSLKARLPRVLEFLGTHRPDVLCLQETKLADEGFPHEELAGAGYRGVHHGTGRWAGVAIVVPESAELTDVVRGLPGEVQAGEARWLEARVGDLGVASVYVPNGRELEHPAYGEKLVFLDAMADRLAALATTGSAYVAGDFNVAPEDRDVWDPTVFVGTTHTSTPERERVRRILAAGFVDAFRHVEPEHAGFTYFDYRAGMFHKGMGMRIDLALVTPDLAARVTSCGIDRDFRKGVKPSDHAPLLLDL